MFFRSLPKVLITSVYYMLFFTALIEKMYFMHFCKISYEFFKIG